MNKHSEYVEIAKSYGVSALKKILINWVVKNLPFFATGPLNLLLVKVATKFAEYAASQAEMAVFFQYVDMRVDGQAKDFEAAMIYNHTMQSTGTVEQKINAEQRLTIALQKLISLKS